MIVRQLQIEDSAALVPLLDQLGYPSTEEAIRQRVASLLSDSRVGCWIAEGDVRTVGLLVGDLSRRIERDGFVARLSALVVDKRARGQGIARRLVSVFEDWAREHGAAQASLSSRMNREDAHAVYRKLGWTTTALTFSKDLSAS
ncbi:GNAT family N-acetyltransferase [Leucobacter sp. L43]|uniref:GNAT family N-acetyltransferase n=1 Tax=Leucobacter sp. L43 TaxID=2798040 RepID=UPI0019077973|nr:GNAT family N-acetyltransferase [Leucobacter sp. L43]